jgi:hypothetical protein
LPGDRTLPRQFKKKIQPFPTWITSGLLATVKKKTLLAKINETLRSFFSQKQQTTIPGRRLWS